MEKNGKIKKAVEPEDEAPPIFRTWLGWYAAVLGFLVVLIILFYWFTVMFSA